MIQIQVIKREDKHYPETLRNIEKSPPLLYAKGNISLLKKNAIAMVGSRHASEYGKRIAETFTKDLVENNTVIVSGLAKGIDSICHHTCLQEGGKTIAVLAGGFNHIDPPEHQALAQLIVDMGGLIISEYPPETPVDRTRICFRNRIITGLSKGIIIVQAAKRSGSLSSANFALKQGKKVFLIPHAIGSPNSMGIYALAKKENTLYVNSTKEIIASFGKEDRISNVFTKRGITSKEKKQLEQSQLEENTTKEEKIYHLLLKQEKMNINEIVCKTGLSIQEVGQTLMRFEIKEIVKSYPRKSIWNHKEGLI